MGDAFRWECPGCRCLLETGFEHWRCSGCGAVYDAWRGIADLRTREDGYLNNAADRAFARQLLDDFDRLDFKGLLERYFSLEPGVPPDLKRRQAAHILTAPERAKGWLDALGGPVPHDLLDLGCGSGSFLAAAGREVPRMCGVDIALRWLLVARKRLDEEGLGDVPLVCACAEDLPLAGAEVSVVVGGDVIEHVADQAATLAEAFRVLKPGGRLFLASPNRFSLALEPHVQVWGVGYLPRRWMSRYVKVVRNVDFRAVRTLGRSEWRKLIRSSPFRGGRITAPPLPPGDLEQFGALKAFVGRCYNAAVATDAGQCVGRAVGPLFHVVCEKAGAEPPPSPTRAIRPRSTPTAMRP